VSRGRRSVRGAAKLAVALALALLSAGAVPQAYRAPRHSFTSPLLTGGTEFEIMLRADAGTQIEVERDPGEELAEHRKLDAALKALQPQRPGVVDAYVISIALDSDPVFGREARAAGEVLKRRYGGTGRTLVLAGTNGSAPSELPRGSPSSFAIALARVAELMDEKEDALILYTTSHGARFGLYYNDGDNGFGAISPNRLAAMLERLGISNRLLILSACYSGIFVPRLQSETSAILTAASADRTSFGCVADNDWTFFGDALINHALRKGQPLNVAFGEATALVANWEKQVRAPPSEPQISLGRNATRWLSALEARMPKAASQPIGRPAIETSLPSR
jgi:hypothetical protein